VWDGLAAVDVVLSPKSQEKVSFAPLGSKEPVLEKETVRGASPTWGAADATTTGGWVAVARIRLIRPAAGYPPPKST
jgi:hypothetical protein